MSARILICGTQVPYSSGGAELLVDSLAGELDRRGFDVERVSLPFAWQSREQILRSALAWRMLDITEAGGRPVDLVITTRFPSYVVRHPNKVVWLIHQFRQVYELEGTRYSDFGDLPDDAEVIETIRRIDRRTLSEARRLCTISGNVAARLESFLGLEGEPLYPPPALGERLRPGPFGDYVFSVGRLDQMKRFDLLLSALARSTSELRLILAGAAARVAGRAHRGARSRGAGRARRPDRGRTSDRALRRRAGGLLRAVRRGLRLRHGGSVQGW